MQPWEAKQKVQRKGNKVLQQRKEDKANRSQASLRRKVEKGSQKES